MTKAIAVEILLSLLGWW